jgi:hypothetical protein
MPISVPAHRFRDDGDHDSRDDPDQLIMIVGKPNSTSAALCSVSKRCPIAGTTSVFGFLRVVTDSRLPDSLFRVLRHAHRITGCKRSLFVIQAA